MSKKIILVTLALVVALALVGCTAQSILGGTEWKAANGIHYRFDKDGTLTGWYESDPSQTWSGSWSAKGNEVTLAVFDETFTYTAKISGTRMTLTPSSGDSLEFIKV